MNKKEFKKLMSSRELIYKNKLIKFNKKLFLKFNPKLK